MTTQFPSKNAVDAAMVLIKTVQAAGADSMTVVLKDPRTGENVGCVVVAVTQASAELLNEFGDMLSEGRPK